MLLKQQLSRLPKRLNISIVCKPHTKPLICRLRLLELGESGALYLFKSL